MTFEELIKQYNIEAPWSGVDEGWVNQILEPLFIYLSNRSLLQKIQIVQIKEKFGGMRIYWDPKDELTEEEYKYIQGMTDFAERISNRICEKCGNAGQLQKGGWYLTLCSVCQNKREQERKR